MPPCPAVAHRSWWIRWNFVAEREGSHSFQPWWRRIFKQWVSESGKVKKFQSTKLRAHQCTIHVHTYTVRTYTYTYVGQQERGLPYIGLFMVSSNVHATCILIWFQDSSTEYCIFTEFQIPLSSWTSLLGSSNSLRNTTLLTTTFCALEREPKRVPLRQRPTVTTLPLKKGNWEDGFFLLPQMDKQFRSNSDSPSFVVSFAAVCIWVACCDDDDDDEPTGYLLHRTNRKISNKPPSCC